jgi:hypothetical protein
LHKLIELWRLCRFPNGASRVRITMVTARAVPAVESVVCTLRSWRALFDEIHFVGGRSKLPFLAAAGADIFFIDTPAHVEAASLFVAAGLVAVEIGSIGHVFRSRENLFATRVAHD